LERASAKAECIVRCANRLGESPVWSVREQRLYWVDCRAPRIFRLDPATGHVDSWDAPCIIGSIGLRRSGGLVVAMQTGFHVLDVTAGALTFIADPESDQPENRFNDGRTDRRGRFWSGTMNDVRRDPTGSLYRLDPDHGVTKIRDDLIVPNAICWSPDDRTMYLADTYRHRILAYDFDLDDGTIGNERQIVDASMLKGRPDGATVDRDGYLWNAEYAGGRVVRRAPDGRIDRVIELPVSQPSSCAFGGPALDILYITTASQRLTPEELAAQPLAGSLFAVDVGVGGVPEPEYGG
jgi:sugar lactone lactonase YvrE